MSIHDICVRIGCNNACKHGRHLLVQILQQGRLGHRILNLSHFGEVSLHVDQCLLETHEQIAVKQAHLVKEGKASDFSGTFFRPRFLVSLS